MALKYSLDTLDGLDDGVKSLYAESNGKFVLQVDGAVPRARLDEFRTTNVTLKQQMEELQARFEGVDPEQFRELSAKAQKEKDKKLIDAGKVDEIVAQRIEAMRAEHDKVLGGLTKERDTFKVQLEGQLIDGALRDAATKAGVRPTAIDDVLLRGRQTFRVADGKAAAFEGDKALYGKDSEPLSVSEWVGGLADRAPHLFDASAGAGAGAGTVGKTNAGGKPSVTRAQFDAMDPAGKANAARTATIVD